MSKQGFDTIDVLRLEVEVEPDGLFNKVPNPSGELGSWGWVSPVAKTIVSVSAIWKVLEFFTEVSQPAHWTTEFMPATAGHWFSARFGAVASSPNHYVRLRFEWYNASHTLISSSAQSSSWTGDFAHHTTTSVQAPANTAYAKLRFDFYNGTGTTNPSGFTNFVFDGVTVASASTAAALGTSRRNLIVNPSMEGTQMGWTGVNASVARSTAQKSHGTYSLAMTAQVSSGALAWAGWGSVVPGRDYVFQYKTRAATTARPTMIAIFWFTAAGQMIYEKNWDGPTNTSSGWTTVSTLSTAPSNAASARLFIGVRSSAPGEVHYFDEFMLTEGMDVPAYFDGSTPASGTITYSWDGAPNQSTSILVDTTIGSMVPTDWRNLLGPSHELKVEREALNLGTLTATMLDATLDPSQTDELRPGRGVRLLSLVEDKWEPIFTGKTTQIDVDYDEKANPPKPPRVFLTAVDNTQALTSVRRPEGVGTVDELPYVLEGAGVPWNVNGSGNQVLSANIVSVNDNATALDQVALTRDSALGEAYVDRRGVLVVSDYAPDPVINGTFDTDITGWNGYNCTLARVTTPTLSGAGAMRITATAAGEAKATTPNGTSAFPAVGGVRYRAGFSSRAATTGRVVVPLLTFHRQDGTVIQTFEGKVNIFPTNNTGHWGFGSGVSAVAPAGTKFVSMDILIKSPVAAGEVHYIDSAYLTTASSTNEADGNVYSDYDTSFSSTDCINSVTVKSIEWDPADTTKSIEVIYGPYEDPASIEQWGRRSAEFTVQGKTSATVQAYANEILARNANPPVRVNSVTIPIYDNPAMGLDHMLGLALQDFGGDFGFSDWGKDFHQTLRVNRITHNITPEKWLMELGFTHSGSVAAPQQTPPVQSGGGRSEAGLIQMFAGTSPPSGWLLCQGQSLAVASYPALHTAIGYTFGGSGSTFNLPDMRGRVAVGVGTATGAAGATNHPLGQKSGEETHLLTAAESGLPAHNHSTTAFNAFVVLTGTPGTVGSNGGGGVTGTSTALNASSAHNNMQPYVGLNYIIKVA